MSRLATTRTYTVQSRPRSMPDADWQDEQDFANAVAVRECFDELLANGTHLTHEFRVIKATLSVEECEWMVSRLEAAAQREKSGPGPYGDGTI